MHHIIYEHAYLHKINLLYVPHSFSKSTTRQDSKLSLRDLPLCIAKFESEYKKKVLCWKIAKYECQDIMKREKKVHESIDDLHTLRLRCVTMETIF